MKFKGMVRKNLGRGTKLGFPTANIEAPKDAEDGIFLGFGSKKPALIFIGAAETFGESDRKAEIYILDFSGDLYGQEIEVEIVKKLRDNQKFETQEELVEQMQKDEAIARDYFARYNKPYELSE